MNTRLAALALAAATVAPAAVWIDLSGDWRMDGRETVQLPLGDRLSGPHELVRVVDLPDDASGVPLSLTIGAIGEWVEVLIDGQSVVTTSSTDPDEWTIARPRTFDLPALTGPRLTITIRAQTFDGVTTKAWRLPDTGPWLLTSPAAAPREAGALEIARRKLLRISDLTQPLMLACLALVVWLIFWRDPRQRALLWLGLLLVAMVAARLWIWVEIREDSTPFRHAVALAFLRICVVLGLLTELGCVTVRIPRWVAGAVWALAAATLCFAPPSVAGWDPPVLFARGVAFAGVALGYWRQQAKRPWLTATYTLALYAQGATSGAGSLSAIGLPILDEAYVYGYRSNPFVMLVTVLAALITAELVRQLLRDREEKVRLAGDVEAARAAQRILLPPAGLSPGPLVGESVYEPAQEVGGDFYLVEPLDGGALLAVVGDVSGKGLKAGMMVSLVVGALRARRTDRPAEILAELNRVLEGRMEGGFVTCAVVRVDPSGQAIVANAGHLAPYAGGRETVVEAGLPLGIVTGAVYEETVLSFNASLTMVTDGVVEASNAQGELFGFDRTREISTKSAREIVEAAKAWGQNDDITVVTVRRKTA